MTDTQHTPGPWQWVPKGQRPWVGRIAEGRWAALACGNTDEEAEANAHLISAAPDLLAALEEFCRECDGYLDGNDGSPWGTLLKGRAAIAKATGK